MLRMTVLYIRIDVGMGVDNDNDKAPPPLHPIPSPTPLTLSRLLIRSGVCVRYIQVVAAMYCVLLHRRHLMLWGVFTPKWIFNTVLYAADVLLVVLFGGLGDWVVG